MGTARYRYTPGCCCTSTWNLAYYGLASDTEPTGASWRKTLSTANSSGGANVHVTAVYTDSSANVYAAAYYLSGSNVDVTVYKFNSSGTQQWSYDVYDSATTGSGAGDCRRIFIQGSNVVFACKGKVQAIANSGGTSAWSQSNVAISDGMFDGTYIWVARNVFPTGTQLYSLDSSGTWGGGYTLTGAGLASAHNLAYDGTYVVTDYTTGGVGGYSLTDGSNQYTYDPTPSWTANAGRRQIFDGDSTEAFIIGRTSVSGVQDKLWGFDNTGTAAWNATQATVGSETNQGFGSIQDCASVGHTTDRVAVSSLRTDGGTSKWYIEYIDTGTPATVWSHLVTDSATLGGVSCGSSGYLAVGAKFV